MNVVILVENKADPKAIWQVNADAFSGSVEADLVDSLRAGGYVEVSLVVEVEGRIVGHILISRVTVRTADDSFEVLSLAPMAVVSQFQNRGIGTRLVEAGLEFCRRTDFKIVVVLGHPDFYPRFGFSSGLATCLRSPFGGRDE